MTFALITITQAVAGVLVAVPSLALAYIGYKRAIAADALAVQAGMATVQTVTTGQVLDSLDALIQRLGEDNAVLRAEIEKLEVKLDVQNDLIAALREEVSDLMRRNGLSSSSSSSSK